MSSRGVNIIRARNKVRYILKKIHIQIQIGILSFLNNLNESL